MAFDLGKTMSTRKTSTSSKATSRRSALPLTARQAQGNDLQRDSLGYALRRAQMRAYDLYFEMLGNMDEINLTPARVTALSLIAMEPEITQAMLARHLNIAGPSALKMVDALETSGLIRREPVATDRRRYSLMLTDEGHERIASLRTAMAKYEERLARNLSASERSQLMALLSRIAD